MILDSRFFFCHNHFGIALYSDLNLQALSQIHIMSLSSDASLRQLALRQQLPLELWHSMFAHCTAKGFLAIFSQNLCRFQIHYSRINMNLT
jgi:hypothetical protein